MLPEVLNDSQINKLADQLYTMQSELRLQLDQARENTEPVTLDQQSVGRVSRIDAIQQQQMAVANRDQLAILLTRVTSALQRVETNEYGFCLQCGEPIGFARLEVQPFAPHCMDCQSAIEQR